MGLVYRPLVWWADCCIFAGVFNPLDDENLIHREVMKSDE